MLYNVRGDPAYENHVHITTFESVSMCVEFFDAFLGESKDNSIDVGGVGNETIVRYHPRPLIENLSVYMHRENGKHDLSLFEFDDASLDTLILADSNDLRTLEQSLASAGSHPVVE